MEDNEKKQDNEELENEDNFNAEDSSKFSSSIPTGLIVVLCIVFWPIGLLLLVFKFSNKNSVEAQTYKRLNITQNEIENTTNLNMLRGRKTSAIVGAIVAFVFGVLFFIVAFDQILFGGNITKMAYEHETSSISTSKSQMQKNESSTDAGAVKEEILDTYKYVFLAAGGLLSVVCFLIGISKWIKAFRIGNRIQKIEIYQNLILIREIYNVNELSSYLRTSKNKILDNVATMIREGYLCGIRIKKNEIEKIPEYVDPNRVFNVICPSCGANNKYTKGIENKCEYCGTVLNLNQLIK